MTQKTEISHSDRLPVATSYPINSTCRDPDDVLHHPTMDREEKKALLASWASDVRAVKDAPGLRQLDSGQIVEVDEIIRALRQLDEPRSTFVQPGSLRLPFYARRPLRQLAKWRRRGRRNGPDDDGTPPAGPAAALLFPRLLSSASASSQPEWA